MGQGPVVLENEQLRIEVDPGNGAIARIVDKQGQIHLAPVGGLADNFRLVLRGADKKNKVILGRSQKLTTLSKAGSGLDLAWNGPLTDSEGGTHSLRVRMEIRLAGPSLEFRLFLQNDTAAPGGRGVVSARRRPDRIRPRAGAGRDLGDAAHRLADDQEGRDPVRRGGT